MDKIYEQAKDLHVVATRVFANGDGIAYKDAEHTKRFKDSELKEVFIKGALIVTNASLYKAVNFTNGNTIGYINASGEIKTLAAETEDVELNGDIPV